MNHLVTEFPPRPDLKYPFEKGWNPEPGVPHEVADGVFWLRVPMPIALDHINLWILRDGDGWVIVDSGLDAPTCKAIWDKVFDDFMQPKSVKRIIITHYHPDHIGLASWLAQRCDCKVWITAGEYDFYHSIVTSDSATRTDQIKEYIADIGFQQDLLSVYRTALSVDDKSPASRLQPETCVFIKHGDELKIGEKIWQVMIGNGHSPEHACLYSAELQVMISGDQALPRISSNISVFISNRHDDPLGDWLDSCARLRDTVPSDTLVFPAHQEPFYRIDLRLQSLIDEHHVQLNRLRILMQKPTTTDQARRVLFDRELSDFEIILATSETLAHINYLLERGEVEQQVAKDKVIYYQIIQDEHVVDLKQ